MKFKHLKTALTSIVLSVCLAASPAVSTLAWDGSEVEATPDQGQVFNFYDAWGLYHCALLDTTARPCPYDWADYWQHVDYLATYENDPNYKIIRGIDVSVFQGDIDWAKVKAAGYDFVIVRLGHSGSRTGSIGLDKNAQINLVNARMAGLLVGAYYFSQATSEAEAITEANAALSLIQGFSLDLPLFYDPEFIRGKACRVDNLTKEQFTANTVAFCSTVAAAGYQPGIYSNLVFEGFHLDMPTIQNYSVWYADYAPIPQTPYDFQYLQISETGQVPGITGDVDVDLMFVPTKQQ